MEHLAREATFTMTACNNIFTRIKLIAYLTCILSELLVTIPIYPSSVSFFSAAFSEYRNQKNKI
jgi:hypothetical protein